MAIFLTLRVDRRPHLLLFSRSPASVRSNFLIHIMSKKIAHDSISMAMLRLGYAQVRSFGGHVKANSGSKFDRFVVLPPLG